MALDLVTESVAEPAELADLPAGYGLPLSAIRAGAGLAVPDGWLAVVPDGRVPLDVARGRVRFVDREPAARRRSRR